MNKIDEKVKKYDGILESKVYFLIGALAPNNEYFKEGSEKYLNNCCKYYCPYNSVNKEHGYYAFCDLIYEQTK